MKRSYCWHVEPGACRVCRKSVHGTGSLFICVVGQPLLHYMGFQVGRPIGLNDDHHHGTVDTFDAIIIITTAAAATL